MLYAWRGRALPVFQRSQSRGGILFSTFLARFGRENHQSVFLGTFRVQWRSFRRNSRRWRRINEQFFYIAHFLGNVFVALQSSVNKWWIKTKEVKVKPNFNLLLGYSADRRHQHDGGKLTFRIKDECDMADVEKILVQWRILEKQLLRQASKCQMFGYLMYILIALVLPCWPGKLNATLMCVKFE